MYVGDPHLVRLHEHVPRRGQGPHEAEGRPKAQQYAQKRVHAHSARHLQTTLSRIWLHSLGWG